MFDRENCWLTCRRQGLIFFAASTLCVMVFLIASGNSRNPAFHGRSVPENSSANARRECKLPRLCPNIINLGFPKTGTTSLHSYYKAIGRRSVHNGYRVGRNKNKRKHAVHSIRRAYAKGLYLLHYLNKAGFDAFAQIDHCDHGDCLLPQVSLLDTLLRQYHDSCFVLNVRRIPDLILSMTHWAENTPRGSYLKRLSKANLDGLPAGVGRRYSDIYSWISNHYERVISRLQGDCNFIVYNISRDGVDKLNSFFGSNFTELPKQNRGRWKYEGSGELSRS
eukprot:gb/GECG01015913.1/.p1 GENE.gb/GECG01015913.1/~~gb/GECG01015913.1/.p1  ORF type:complete len:279 (+),score=11.55 gb/GECG01015913.1/:1-837(+)